MTETPSTKAPKSGQPAGARIAGTLPVVGIGMYEHGVPIEPEMYHSEQWAGMLGYKEEELPPCDLFMDWLMEHIHPDDVPVVEKAHADFIAGATGQYEVEVRMKKKSGEWIRVQSLGRAMSRDAQGLVTRVLGVARDVTEIRRAEESVARRDSQMKLAQEIARLGYWTFDIATGQPEWSEMMFSVLGRDPAAGVPEYDDHRDFIHPDDWDAFDRAVRGAIAGTPYHIELRIVFPDQSIRHVMAHGYSQRDANGNVAALFGVAQDVTERKQAEERLEAGLIDLELAQRIAHVGNWSLDPAVGVPVWSDEVYRIYERDPALGPPPVEDYKKLYAFDQYEIFYGAIQRAIEEGEPYDIHLHLTLAGGKTKWVHALCRPDSTPGPAGHFLRGTIQDITEVKRAEEQLQAYSQRLEDMVAARTRELEAAQKELLLKERLAVLGHFAGSISHELRNPLAAIDSAAYLLDMKYGETDKKIRTWISQIQKNVAQASETISSLLSLTKRKAPKTRPTALDALIHSALSITAIPSTVETVLDLPDPPPALEIDPRQSRLALKNIFQNAVQAMAESGRIVVSARLADDDHLEILVSDTGPGLPPESAEKVFDPLFSTKTHGIGFGLSIAKMIAENHGGALRAASGIGGGAAFVLSLPTMLPI